MLENFLGKKCLVRTYSAGVFFGVLETYENETAVVKNARRIWYWKGAASLSQLAIDGTSAPHECKFPAAVEHVFLTKVIEIIPCTDKSIASIEAVNVWEC